jgi:hypothetical protein
VHPLAVILVICGALVFGALCGLAWGWLLWR